MTTPLFSIGGLASGLDTDNMVRQLLALERQPIVRFQQRQAELNRAGVAWGSIVTRLSIVRSTVDGLRDPAAITDRFKVTSSNDAAVSITRTGTPEVGSTELTVDRLATAHQLTLGGTYSSADAVLQAGTVTLTDADGAQLGTVTTDGSTTLAGVATAINDLGTDVRASVVAVRTGEYQLVLAGKSTGDAKVFSADGGTTGLAGSTIVTQGGDAQLRLGGLAVARATNTVTDLVAGATLQLKATTASAVRLDVTRDIDGAFGAVKKLVDDLNVALSTMAEVSKQTAKGETKTPLQANSLVRQLADELRSALRAPVPGAPAGRDTAAAIGIGFDRYGKVTLDETTLRAALTDDPALVTSVLSRAGTTTSPDLRYVGASDRTVAGTYTVDITAPASRATVLGAATATWPTTFTITSGSTDVAVDLTTAASIADVVELTRQALTAAGVSTIAVAEEGGAVRLTESRYGAAHGFTVAGSADLGLDGAVAGTDVAGTFTKDGTTETAVGTGTVLVGVGDGLGLRVDTVPPAAGAVGSVTLTGGLTGVLDGVLKRYEGTTGMIQRARDTLTGEVRRFDDRIAEVEERLVSRETTLRRQFTALEAALAKMQAQGNWLASQLPALQANTSGPQ